MLGSHQVSDVVVEEVLQGVEAAGTVSFPWWQASTSGVITSPPSSREDAAFSLWAGVGSGVARMLMGLLRHGEPRAGPSPGTATVGGSVPNNLFVTPTAVPVRREVVAQS